MFNSAEVSAHLGQVLAPREIALLVLYLRQKQLSEGHEFSEALSSVLEKLSIVMVHPNFSGLFSGVSLSSLVNSVSRGLLAACYLNL